MIVIIIAREVARHSPSHPSLYLSTPVTLVTKFQTEFVELCKTCLSSLQWSFAHSFTALTLTHLKRLVESVHPEPLPLVALDPPHVPLPRRQALLPPPPRRPASAPRAVLLLLLSVRPELLPRLLVPVAVQMQRGGREGPEQRRRRRLPENGARRGGRREDVVADDAAGAVDALQSPHCRGQAESGVEGPNVSRLRGRLWSKY